MGLRGTPHLLSSIGHPLPWERAVILISLPLPWEREDRKAGGVRGFFAGDAFMAMELCDARDFDETLHPHAAALQSGRRFVIVNKRKIGVEGHRLKLDNTQIPALTD